jgi:excisionase family DNA binding protein
MSERLLTAAEVAELLAVPVSWVREGTRAGRLPHLALGRYRRYSRPAIEAWLEDQRAGPLPTREGLDLFGQTSLE